VIFGATWATLRWLDSRRMVVTADSAPAARRHAAIGVHTLVGELAGSSPCDQNSILQRTGDDCVRHAAIEVAVEISSNDAVTVADVATHGR